MQVDLSKGQTNACEYICRIPPKWGSLLCLEPAISQSNWIEKVGEPFCSLRCNVDVRELNGSPVFNRDYDLRNDSRDFGQYYCDGKNYPALRLNILSLKPGRYMFRFTSEGIPELSGIGHVLVIRNNVDFLPMYAQLMFCVFICFLVIAIVFGVVARTKRSFD